MNEVLLENKDLLGSGIGLRPELKVFYLTSGSFFWALLAEWYYCWKLIDVFFKCVNIFGLSLSCN